MYRHFSEIGVITRISEDPTFSPEKIHNHHKSHPADPKI